MQTIPFIENIKAHIVNPLLKFMIAAGVVVFLWGVAEYVFNSGNEEKRTEGQKHMLWGVVGLAIMISVFGIIRLACSVIGVQC